MKIENQVVCVLCGEVNPGSRWISHPVHAQCVKPSEVSASYKAYSMLGGLTVEAIRDLCRQLGVRFTYRYKNANGKMSRLFHDKSYLVYQIVRVKGSAEAGAQPTQPDAAEAEGAEAGDAGDAGAEAEGADAAQPAEAGASDITPTIAMWVQWVQKFREVAARRGMKVAITPRATQRGAVMLAHGIDLGNVARLEIGNRMSAQDWQNLQNDAGINAPLPIVGKHKYLQHKHTDLLLALVRARVHVWLAGPAGSGKSKVAEIVSQKLALPFYCTGAVASEYKLSGFVDAQGRAVITQFRKAFSEGGVFLFDEIDRSLPNAVLPFNGWLANLKADMPGNDGLVDAHADFVALVGANTNGQGATAEYSGAMKQDAAFLDRFAILTWDYDTELEAEVAHLAARNAVKARNARKGA